MKSDIDSIYQKGIRLAPDAYDFLEAFALEPSALQKILASGKFMLTKDDIDTMLSAEEKIPVETIVSRSPAFKPAAKEYSPNFKVIEKSDVSGKSRCTGKLEDFVAHFRDRYARISKIVRARVTQNAIVVTSKLKSTSGSKVRLIAMVNRKQMTKKGNVLLEVEDEEGVAKVVVMKDTPGFKVHHKIMNDDIIALDGKNADELFICDNVEWPDIPVAREMRKSERDLGIAYLSDLHFGSKKCLEAEFSHFISWLNGSEGRADLAGKVKYLIIAGDVADGIGIYPDQEKELAVKDIYKQYAIFDSFMEKIPDYITVIVGPGNHDAVRRAEPQPIIPYDMLKGEVVRVGSPSRVEIEGLKHLIYHGNSLDSIIAASGLTYDKPHEAMLELVRRRHLSPIYGQNLIVPEAHDYLVMEDEPDVVHMGHVHKNGHMLYRGTLLLNSGTFQDRTDFQVRMGHMPSPGLVPILETKTGKVNYIGFKEGVGT
ncbi:MAG: DNA-directed DNA polymerase II small subunit [Candidatus Micrarchaeia archaeon]